MLINDAVKRPIPAKLVLLLGGEKREGKWDTKYWLMQLKQLQHGFSAVVGRRGIGEVMSNMLSTKKAVWSL